MSNLVKVLTIPEKREDKKVSEKIKLMVEDRNRKIAERFSMEPQEVTVHLHYSRSKLLTDIRFQGDSLGIYCGFLEDTNVIHLIHPSTVTAIFGENLDKEFIIFIDYSLTKFYFNKKYYPDMKDYKMYFKYLSEALAKISSGNFRKEIIQFDMKTFSPNRKYNKEKELMIAFYIILDKAGLDYIYEILDDLVKTEDIKKFIFEKFNKSFNELVENYKSEILEEERKAQIKFRNERKGQRDQQQINKNINSQNSFNNNFKKTYIRKTNYKVKENYNKSNQKK
jgi:DNA-binding transcriptional ArsR family regulator